MKNIYLAWMDYMDYFKTRTQDAINSYYEQNPEGTYDDAVEAARAATIFDAKEIYEKRHSLAIESAKMMGFSEEEISAMIEEFQNYGWSYRPSIVEDIRNAYTHDAKINSDGSVEYIRHDRIPEQLLDLTPEVANYIYQKVSAEPKYGCISIDNGLTR